MLCRHFNRHNQSVNHPFYFLFCFFLLRNFLLWSFLATSSLFHHNYCYVIYIAKLYFSLVTPLLLRTLYMYCEILRLAKWSNIRRYFPNSSGNYHVSPYSIICVSFAWILEVECFDTHRIGRVGSQLSNS